MPKKSFFPDKLGFSDLWKNSKLPSCRASKSNHTFLNQFFLTVHGYQIIQGSKLPISNLTRADLSDYGGLLLSWYIYDNIYNVNWNSHKISSNTDITPDTGTFVKKQETLRWIIFCILKLGSFKICQKLLYVEIRKNKTKIFVKITEMKPDIKADFLLHQLVQITEIKPDIEANLVSSIGSNNWGRFWFK